jgi:hypothetical protein
MIAEVDDNTHPLLQPDVLLSSQWADCHRQDSLTPEHRLVAAILRDALLSIVRPCGKPSTRQMRRTEALTWLLGAEDCYISFDFTCAVLGIDDSEAFRQRLLTALTALEQDGHSGRAKLTHIKLERP